MNIRVKSSEEDLVCTVCYQSGHGAGIECPSCCGICGGTKDVAGNCNNKCSFKDFWDVPAISNGIPVAWRGDIHPTIFVNWVHLWNHHKRVG